MDIKEISQNLEAILFAAGEPVSARRIAQVLGIELEEVLRAAKMLQDYYTFEMRGIRLVRLSEKLQLCSAPECSENITRTLEQRKPPKLSPAALEVLAVTAYFQPVTRAYIDQVRGVDSSYTVGILCERGLIEKCGKLDVPGRPSLYKTSDAFLRVMGISDLGQLPPLPDLSKDESIIALQNSIESLKSAELEGQMSIEE